MTFDFFVGREAFCISEELYLFPPKRDDIRGKKRTALFQTHNWEKSSFFSTLVLVFAPVYANTLVHIELILIV